MRLRLDPNIEAQRVSIHHTKTCMAFRNDILKTTHDDIHLRHIFRFYIARVLFNQGADQIFVLPQILLNDHAITVGILAQSGDSFTVGLCQPGSITLETEELLERFKEVENTKTVILHSQFGTSGNIPTRFESQLVSKQFRLLSIVPPSFDDAYEY